MSNRKLLADAINQYDDPEELLSNVAELLKERANHGEARQKEQPDALVDPIVKLLINRDRQWSTALNQLIDELGIEGE